MDDRDHARLRAREDRELYAIRRMERALEREEYDLMAGLKTLADHELEIEVEIEREWRVERWGHDPERPPAWRVKH